MIPLSLFNVLVAVEVLLVLYSIIDVRNKYYGNIVTAFIASLLGIYLAVVISVGVVQYDPSTTTLGVPIFDASVGYMLMIFAVVMMIYALVMIYDAYVERRMEQESEE